MFGLLKEVDMTFNTRTIEHILFKLYTNNMTQMSQDEKAEMAL